MQISLIRCTACSILINHQSVTQEKIWKDQENDFMNMLNNFNIFLITDMKY